MKKKNITVTLVLALVLVLTAGLAACSPDTSQTGQAQRGGNGAQNSHGSQGESAPVTDLTAVDADGNTSINPGDVQANLVVTGELSQDEIDSLLFMREEEKLAHDVYIALYEQWGLRIFQNIANSEQAHTEAVKTLLEAYGLDDPAAGTATGVFINPDLQDLYDQLTVQGSQSLGDALLVGAAIEEIDILDLENALEQTENPDIQMVYQNLLKGSYNHLRAFTSNFARQTGETYQPQYLSLGEYESIVGSNI